jgi:NADPH-dependent 2,4-dienoyl-CoA reductase/sulfur reductase-like enzyme
MNPHRLVIIGGVAGGASAAARARRLSEEAEIIVLERGPHVSFANCGLPYFVGGEIVNEEDLLVQTPTRLDSEQEELLRRLAALRDESTVQVGTANEGGGGLFSRLKDAFTSK